MGQAQTWLASRFLREPGRTASHADRDPAHRTPQRSYCPSLLATGGSIIPPQRPRSGHYCGRCCCLRHRIPASTKPSISPSNTALGLPVSYSVRRSFTIWYGWSTYERIWSPQEPATSPRRASILAASSARLTASSCAFRTVIAVALFCSCERSFWHETTIPVGRWVSRTAESV